MNLICKWFGHKLPYRNRTGWFSPGEQYVRMKGGYTDGIQRIHVDLYAECERCGDKYLLCRSHVNDESMKAAYEIIKYQRGRIGERLANET
jgi:hypothetical protein